MTVDERFDLENEPCDFADGFIDGEKFFHCVTCGCAVFGLYMQTHHEYHERKGE